MVRKNQKNETKQPKKQPSKTNVAQEPTKQKTAPIVITAFIVTWVLMAAGMWAIVVEFEKTPQIVRPILSPLEQNYQTQFKRVASLEERLVLLELVVKSIDERSYALEKQTQNIAASQPSSSPQPDIPSTDTQPNHTPPSEEIAKTTEKLNDDTLASSVIESELTPLTSEHVAPLLEPEGSFEYMAYEKEGLGAGLSDISDRTAILEEQIFSLKERLATDTKNKSSTGLILAAIDLREAVSSPRAYDNELQILLEHAPDDRAPIEEHIQTLLQHTHSQLVSETHLQQNFNTLVEPIMESYLSNKQEHTLLDQVYLHFSNIVQIRKIGSTTQGKETPDIIARAEHFMQFDDLASAVAEISSLKEPQLSIARPWLDLAKARLQTKASSQAIFDYITNPEYNNQTDTHSKALN